MDRITADATTLMHQAGATAATYYRKAVETIEDADLDRDPTLIGAFMHVAAEDFHSTVLLAGLQELAEAVADLANAIRTRD